jgi:hypothetical protein
MSFKVEGQESTRANAERVTTPEGFATHEEAVRHRASLWPALILGVIVQSSEDPTHAADRMGRALPIR